MMYSTPERGCCMCRVSRSSSTIRNDVRLGSSIVRSRKARSEKISWRKKKLMEKGSLLYLKYCKYCMSLFPY